MDKRFDICPRLIDYLVIVGSHHPGVVPPSKTVSDTQSDGQSTYQDTSAQSGTVTQPEILRRYPLEDHKDFHLPVDVTSFCQPEGCVNVGPRRVTSYRESTSFVFTLTEKDSAKIRYGICLNFYRSFESRPAQTTSDSNGQQRPIGRRLQKRKGQKCHTLTSLCFISHHPFFSTFREALVILRRLIDASNERTSAKKLGSGSKLGR